MKLRKLFGKDKLYKLSTDDISPAYFKLKLFIDGKLKEYKDFVDDLEKHFKNNNDEYKNEIKKLDAQIVKAITESISFNTLKKPVKELFEILDKNLGVTDLVKMKQNLSRKFARVK